MEPTTEPPQCFRCDRQALTFDDQHRPLCGRHATFFVLATRKDADSGAGQERRSEKASEAEDPGTEQHAVSGSHLRLIINKEPTD